MPGQTIVIPPRGGSACHGRSASDTIVKAYIVIDDDGTKERRE
jgi:hypothetical protein